jgi:hypothetical protein
MRSLHTRLLCTAAGVLTLFTAGQAAATTPTYQHVLLISVDGLHSIDLANYIQNHPTSNMAALAHHGIVYPNAFTTAPSDSYPGMLAQVTGASPKTAGLFYDDSYDRHEYPSVNYWVSQGLPDPGCTGGAGTEVTNFEELDKGYNFQTQLVSDITGGGTLDQVYTQLDTDNMQRHIVNGKCKPIFPHEYVRANTVFEIAKTAGLYTAWSDKHPAYEDLAGPSGKGLDELFAPEINSQDTLDKGAQPGDDYTTSYTGVRTYDAIKVQGVLNWIDGLNAVGTTKLAGAPAIFGMNFQAVSVGQKLATAGDADVNKTLTGGYLDSNATPGSALTLELKFVDDSLGKFRKALSAQGLENSTLIIVSAKHGQSPIDVRDRVTMSDAPFQAVPGFGTHGFEICDDEGLIWLEPDLEKANYKAAEAYLRAHAAELHIEQLLDRKSLTSLYEDPFHNSRVPDFIAVTDHGVICTGGSKLAEHGGFSDDDRNVGLLLSAPDIKPQIVESLVYTTQIAPTILDALGLDPSQLIGVQKEGTQALTY